jgi:hypothetical protein
VPIIPPGFLQDDDIRLEGAAGIRDIERAAVIRPAAMQVETGQHQRVARVLRQWIHAGCTAVTHILGAFLMGLRLPLPKTVTFTENSACDAAY